MYTPSNQTDPCVLYIIYQCCYISSICITSIYFNVYMTKYDLPQLFSHIISPKYETNYNQPTKQWNEMVTKIQCLHFFILFLCVIYTVAEATVGLVGRLPPRTVCIFFFCTLLYCPNLYFNIRAPWDVRCKKEKKLPPLFKAL